MMNPFDVWTAQVNLSGILGTVAIVALPVLALAIIGGMRVCEWLTEWRDRREYRRSPYFHSYPKDRLIVGDTIHVKLPKRFEKVAPKPEQAGA